MGKTKIFSEEYSKKVSPYGFLKGYKQLPVSRIEQFTNELAVILNCKMSKVTFYKRLKGEIEPKASEYFAITRLFNSYGITEIWGA